MYGLSYRNSWSRSHNLILIWKKKKKIGNRFAFPLLASYSFFSIGKHSPIIFKEWDSRFSLSINSFFLYCHLLVITKSRDHTVISAQTAMLSDESIRILCLSICIPTFLLNALGLFLIFVHRGLFAHSIYIITALLQVSLHLYIQRLKIAGVLSHIQCTFKHSVRADNVFGIRRRILHRMDV